MKAGQLDQRVTVEQQVEIQDGTGQVIVEWAVLAIRWAAVEPLRGRDYLVAQQIPVNELTTRIRLRYLRGVRPGDRVLHGDDVYDVVTVITPRSQRRETELMCRKLG